jgi:hypothetical protein
MPIPTPKPNEVKNEFIARCMSDETMLKEFPEAAQRLAVCQTQIKNRNGN